MCHSLLESTLSLYNVFLDLLISRENIVSGNIRIEPQNKKCRPSEKAFSLFLLRFPLKICPPFLSLQPREVVF